MPKKACRNHGKNIKKGCKNEFKIDEKRDPILDVLPSGKKSLRERPIGPRGAPQGSPGGPGPAIGESPGSGVPPLPPTPVAV